MDIRAVVHLVLGGILAVVIYAGYRQIHADVRLLYEGKNHPATVVEIEPQPAYTYVRIEYAVNRKTFSRSYRLKEPRAWKHGQKIEIRILPENPEIMSLEFDSKKVYNAVYYVFLVFLMLVIYRTIWLTVKSTRPNWD